MKKIKGLKKLDLDMYSGQGYIDRQLEGKINEIIVNQNLIIDRLNQEVSQPEEKKPRIVYVGVEEFEENRCKNKVENNTEECKHKYILESHCMGLLRIRCPLCGDIRDIADSTPIQELLSERSFSKEELEYIKEFIEFRKGHYRENGKSEWYFNKIIDILYKIDRLLSSEK